MTVDRDALEALSREALVVEAERKGVRRPEVMTRVELVDELVRLGTPNPVARKQARGFFGVARDLVASLVEQGLHLPDAAALIRGDVRYEPLRAPQPPVATVTLAEIYGAQGHYAKALGILDEVLDKEPEHVVARRLREKIARDRGDKRGDAPRIDPEPEVAPPSSSRPTGVPAPPPDEPDAPTVPPPPDPETLPPPAEADPETLPPAPSSEPQARPEAIEPEAKRVPSEVLADALVVARIEPGWAHLYYELESRSPDPALVIRVVEQRPTTRGTERIERDLSIPAARGTLAVDGVAAGSALRAAIGERGDSGFRALAVAVELAGESVVWRPFRRPEEDALVRRAMDSLRVPS